MVVLELRAGLMARRFRECRGLALAAGRFRAPYRSAPSRAGRRRRNLRADANADDCSEEHCREGAAGHGRDRTVTTGRRAADAEHFAADRTALLDGRVRNDATLVERVDWRDRNDSRRPAIHERFRAFDVLVDRACRARRCRGSPKAPVWRRSRRSHHRRAIGGRLGRRRCDRSAAARPDRFVRPRSLHPLAWWIWALALATAALRTTDPLLLALLVAVAWLVVAARRSNAPWARSFGSFLRFGLAIIVVRVFLQMLFGDRLPGHVLFSLPQQRLPSWAAGVTLGGAVTTESIVSAFNEGLQLATLIACVGAANSLASPYRLLRVVPSVLYELGVVVTVALSFAPQTVVAAAGIRDARRLRGRPHRGLRGLRGLAVPVLEGALERSLDLAASMDSRGYGRRGDLPDRRRWVSQTATLFGALAIIVGVFGVLDSGAPFVLGLPMLGIGAVLLVVSLRAARSSSTRSRYRPDPWGISEWVTVAAGVSALGALVAAGHLGIAGLHPDYSPLVAPALPLLPAIGILAAAVPAFASPPLPVETP
jgi:energy-coupling factor transport system permease protein